MDVQRQIERFKEFFETHLLEELARQLREGEKFVVVSFSELSAFSPELAEQVLENPEETIRAAELAVERLELVGDKKGFKVRFKDLPPSHKLMIRDIRSKHIGVFVVLEGLVRQKSDVRPQVTSAKFECPSCGVIIPVLQLDQKFSEPTRCSCGRKGKFRLLSKELVDAQKIVLEEAPEDLEGGEQPKRLGVFLKSDLVSPMTDKKTNPGSKISVSGIIKEVPIILQTGGQSTRFDLVCDANFVEPVQEDFSQVEISKEEEEEITALAKDPLIFSKMVNSIAPTIYGHERIKQALVLQLLGGVRKEREHGVPIRGDIHILLIGDPGSGKSILLKRISQVAPKARFTSGRGASGAGLTASVVRDDFLRGWALEAGAIVLANRGLLCLDEMDKMTKEDTSGLHEALEQQTVSISKANIQATLRAETTVLAAANPKFGRFDPFGPLAQQIELPSTLINRFDLIFPVKDLPDPEKDEELASFILKGHQHPGDARVDIGPELLRKYISYARQKCFPVLSDEALATIREFYVKMRSSADDDSGIRSIPISARQLEALVRLSEASAKTRLSNVVTEQDARLAIDLLNHCLSQIGLDPETGKFDIDRITTGITASQRSHIAVVKEVIAELERVVGKVIPVDDVVREAEIKGISEERAEEAIEKLKRSGDIFSPRQGFISRI